MQAWRFDSLGSLDGLKLHQEATPPDAGGVAECPRCDDRRAAICGARQGRCHCAQRRRRRHRRMWPGGDPLRDRRPRHRDLFPAMEGRPARFSDGLRSVRLHARRCRDRIRHLSSGRAGFGSRSSELRGGCDADLCRAHRVVGADHAATRYPARRARADHGYRGCPAVCAAVCQYHGRGGDRADVEYAESLG
jgi:hypothetical protein